MYHSLKEKKRRSSNDELDIFQNASNKKMEISEVFFFCSVVEEGIIFSFSVIVICPLSLFVKKGTDRSVVLFEQSRRNNWIAKISILLGNHISTNNRQRIT